jgi:hypothetical protein
MVELYRTLADLQTRIERANAVNIDRNVENYHADISLEELREVLGEPGLEVGGMSFTKPSNPRYREPHLFLHPDHRERLVQHSPLEVGVTRDNVYSVATAVEEISHWVYSQQYKQRFGRWGETAATELIGSVDKCNITCSFPLVGVGEEEIRRSSFEADQAPFGSPLRTPEYLIAHKLGRGFIEHLDTLGPDAARKMVHAYHLEDKELLRFLMYDVGLRIPGLEEREEQQVMQHLQDLRI